MLLARRAAASGSALVALAPSPSRNRFYIGEVIYKGKIHPGEQAPIMDRELFEAVQAKLAAGATAVRH